MRALFCAIFISILTLTTFAQVDPSAVTIARDTFGIPHMFTKTDAEVAYGLAWAHCEDDFEHMQMMLIMANARMGEISGKEGAATDYFVQLIRAKEHVEQFYDRDISTDYQKILQAYADGINAFAKQHPKQVELKNLFPVDPKTILRGYHLILTSMVCTPRALEYFIKGKPDEYIFNATNGTCETFCE